jgi:neogenin
MSINATLKSDVEFECMAYGVPKPQIQWFKNGEPIYPSGYFQFNSNQGSLKILGVIAQDEGYYQCLISNELNTIHSVAQLNIIADDYDSSSDDDYDFDYTTRKEKITSRHKHTTNKQQIVQLSAPVNLTVVNKKSRSFQIEWQKPSVITSPTHVLPKNVSNLLTYEINWKAKNDDRQRELNITQNSVLIDDTTADTMYLVTVCALLEANKSPCSTIEVKTDPELVMPGPPVEFKAELLDLNTQSQTTLKFKWKKPALNAENIIKYRLYYQHLNYGHLDANKKQNDYELTSGESNENNNNMMDTNDDYSNDDEKSKTSSEKYLDIEIPNLESSDSFYEFLLEDLLKYSTYKFTLVAINKQMLVELDSNNTSTELDEHNQVNFKPNFKLNGADLFIETPSDVPDGPPENLQIEALNTTSVLFQWDMPSLEKRNGLIVGYKISIKENDKQIWHSNEDSEPRKKIINGLLPLHKYSIRVVARTQNGTGPASDWIIAETFTHEMDETRVPGQPVDLFTEPTDKSIVIRWLPPSDSNKTLVRKYLLKYGIGYPSSEVQISGTRNSYIINDLSNNFKDSLYIVT